MLDETEAEREARLTKEANQKLETYKATTTNIGTPKSFPSGVGQGWHNDSFDHGQASRGIATRNSAMDTQKPSNPLAVQKSQEKPIIDAEFRDVTKKDEDNIDFGNKKDEEDIDFGDKKDKKSDDGDNDGVDFDQENKDSKGLLSKIADKYSALTGFVQKEKLKNAKHKAEMREFESGADQDLDTMAHGTSNNLKGGVTGSKIPANYDELDSEMLTQISADNVISLGKNRESIIQFTGTVRESLEVARSRREELEQKVKVELANKRKLYEIDQKRAELKNKETIATYPKDAPGMQPKIQLMNEDVRYKRDKDNMSLQNYQRQAKVSIAYWGEIEKHLKKLHGDLNGKLQKMP
jgi:hypothetical protein